MGSSPVPYLNFLWKEIQLEGFAEPFFWTWQGQFQGHQRNLRQVMVSSTSQHFVGLSEPISANSLSKNPKEAMEKKARESTNLFLRKPLNAWTNSRSTISKLPDELLCVLDPFLAAGEWKENWGGRFTMISFLAEPDACIFNCSYSARRASYISSSFLFCLNSDIGLSVVLHYWKYTYLDFSVYFCWSSSLSLFMFSFSFSSIFIFFIAFW